MRLPDLYRLLSIAGLIILAGCGGQAATPTSAPAVPTSALAAPTAAPAAPTAAPAAPTAAPAAPTAAPAAPTSAPAAPTAASAAPTSAPVSAIPGALVRGSVTKRPMIVMIDNHPNAYPQAGLDKATIVFESLAEFGLTRFMAVFVPGITPEVATIGPVRSTRLYFAQWALPFGAIYAHAGGSPEGLALAESSPAIINLDALFRANSAYFARDSSRDAPHNLYTSSANLEQANASSSTNPALRADIGYLFKEEAPVAQRPKAQTVGYFFLYREDDIRWIYDPATNTYGRIRKGRPAVDAVTGEQLHAKNIVVMEVKEAAIQGDEKGRIEQQVIGSGKAHVFLDGVEREVTWSKYAPEEPLIFTDASGAEVQFNPGNIWIVSLPTLDNLEVS